MGPTQGVVLGPTRGPTQGVVLGPARGPAMRSTRGVALGMTLAPLVTELLWGCWQKTHKDTRSPHVQRTHLAVQ